MVFACRAFVCSQTNSWAWKALSAFQALEVCEMSKPSAHTFAVVYYSRVLDLLQEVERETPSVPICIHLEPYKPEISGWCAWGVLVTAFTGFQVHAAWIAVGKSNAVMVTSYREQTMLEARQQLHDRLAEYVKQRGLVVRPGAYEVSSVVFRQSAELPADLPATVVEGGA